MIFINGRTTSVFCTVYSVYATRVGFPNLLTMSVPDEEEFQDTKVVPRRRTDNIMAKRKRTTNDLQNTAQKTKDRPTRTSLKIRGELT
jgi:hypothetical protein